MPVARGTRSRRPFGWNYRTSLPTSACFGEEGDFQAVLFNPSSQADTATIFAAGKNVGTVEVAAGQLLVHRIGKGG